MYIGRGRTHPSCCISASLQQFLYPIQRGVVKIKIPTLVCCANFKISFQKNVYIMQKHCYILQLSLNSQNNTDLHFQQLYTSGTTCHYIPYKQYTTFNFLFCLQIDIFLFQCSLLYCNSNCHFSLKQVSHNVSLSIWEIITKKAGLSSIFADLHSGCPVQMSAMTITTLTVSMISINQLWHTQVQHCNSANTATFQILLYFIHVILPFHTMYTWQY